MYRVVALFVSKYSLVLGFSVWHTYAFVRSYARVPCCAPYVVVLRAVCACVRARESILRPLALRCAPPSGVLLGRVSRVFVQVRESACWSVVFTYLL